MVKVKIKLNKVCFSGNIGNLFREQKLQPVSFLSFHDVQQVSGHHGDWFISKKV
jgi:hypothetical protein